MDTNLDAKTRRRPWTARDLALVLAMVLIAGALVWEHVTRVGAERDARDVNAHQSDVATKRIDSHELDDQKWKLDADKKIQELRSRVSDLENVNRERGGR